MLSHCEWSFFFFFPSFPVHTALDYPWLVLSSSLSDQIRPVYPRLNLCLPIVVSARVTFMTSMPSTSVDSSIDMLRVPLMTTTEFFPTDDSGINVLLLHFCFSPSTYTCNILYDPLWQSLSTRTNTLLFNFLQRSLMVFVTCSDGPEICGKVGVRLDKELVVSGGCCWLFSRFLQLFLHNLVFL